MYGMILENLTAAAAVERLHQIASRWHCLSGTTQKRIIIRGRDMGKGLFDRSVYCLAMRI